MRRATSLRVVGWAVLPLLARLVAGTSPAWAETIGRGDRQRAGAPAVQGPAPSPPGSVPGQEVIAALIDKPVTAVTLRAEGLPLEEPDILKLIETRVGQPLSMALVRETILHLFSLQRFQDVQVAAARAGEGVALTYELVPIHVVDAVRFEGRLGLGERELRQAVIERYGRSPSAGQAAAAATYTQRWLNERGFTSASVEPTVDVDHERERSTLVLRVEAGRRAIVSEVVVTGNPVVPTAQVLDRLGIDAGDPYDRPAIDRGVARYADELKNRGYYEAEVGVRAEPRSELGVTLIVEARPGPKVVLAFEGDQLPPRQLEELVPVKREGSVDEDLLEDSSRRIEEALKADGYWRATTTYRREQAGENEVRLVFTIKKGRLARVGAISVGGTLSVPAAEVAPLMALAQGDLFLESRLTATTSAIRELLRRTGHAAARVVPEVSPMAAPEGARADADLVRIRLVADEGPQSTIGDVRFSGHDALTEGDLRALVAAAPGQPYYPPQIATDREAILYRYLDRGYELASVEVATEFSPDRRRADVTYQVREGPRVLVDHIIIVGNTRTRTATIENELTLRPGAPLGYSALIESQRRLAALGLFRRVRITELVHAEPGRRDVLVSVEEAPATSLGYGAGLEASTRSRRIADETFTERLELAPRGFFEVGRRNLWGKNRSIDLFTRLSARPRNSEVGGYGLNEYRGLATYREPRAFGRNADAFVSGVLERAIRSSFSYNRRALQAQIVRRMTPQVNVSGHYSFERTKLFDEQISPDDELLVDRLYPRVRLSSFSMVVLRDTRSDPLAPESGLLLGVDSEIAARALGSQVGYAKIFGQAFWFRRIGGRGGGPIVLATGARLGLGRGFAQVVPQLDEQGAPLVDAGGQPLLDTIEEIPASERFFAGGDNTVRGFALDRLGDDPTLDQNGVPKGGNAVIVLNGELRLPVWQKLSAVGFVDVGNVFARVSDADLGRLRGGVGFGIRYESPVGPIRFDLGFKLDRKTFANGNRERPTALHISIGHAF